MSAFVSRSMMWTWICAGDPFFFSSRRRHTSSTRDWSSDVCSSDLFVAEETTVKDHGLVNFTDRQRNVIHAGSGEEPSLSASLRYRRSTEDKERIAPGNRVK